MFPHHLNVSWWLNQGNGDFIGFGWFNHNLYDFIGCNHETAAMNMIFVTILLNLTKKHDWVCVIGWDWNIKTWRSHRIRHNPMKYDPYWNIRPSIIINSGSFYNEQPVILLRNIGDEADKTLWDIVYGSIRLHWERYGLKELKRQNCGYEISSFMRFIGIWYLYIWYIVDIDYSTIDAFVVYTVISEIYHQQYAMGLPRCCQGGGSDMRRTRATWRRDKGKAKTWVSNWKFLPQ